MQKAPVDLLLAGFAFGAPLPAHGGGEIDEPDDDAQRRQHQQGQPGAHPARRCNEERAEQRAAGVAAVHQVHAPGAVGGVVADQNGAGVHGAALGDAHQEERDTQQQLRAGEAHHPIAQRIARGQQQNTGLEAQHPGQHAGQETRQQVANAHQGEQSARHAIGKAVFLLQQADHHTAGNGADPAEKECEEARIAQAGVLGLLFHGRLLLVLFLLLFFI